jgi:hypothetical protein
MAIKLTDIKDIANIIKTKYGQDLYMMSFVFCFKKSANSYFIFQEIQGMPIKRVVYHESNNSVTFAASWASWSNPFALVADANCEKLESWKDLQDRSRPYNSYIEVDGGFNTSEWTLVNKQNKKEKKKRHKNKSDSFFEFRIDKIDRAVFKNDYFELYSPTISMIAFKGKYSFPYKNDFEDDGSEHADPSTQLGQVYTTPIFFSSVHGPQDWNTPVFPTPVEEPEETEILKVSWQGRSFHIPEFHDNAGEITPVSSGDIPGGGGCDLTSYWVKDDEDSKEFDEEMGNYFLDDREKDDSILDVGQKEINLLFDD